YKVLLVDDNDFNIMLIRQMVIDILPESIIFESKNGREAIEQYNIEKPDLIFMDVQMPELNGHEATQIIRSLEKGLHIPIIALTAGTNTAELNLCLESGMNDVITKPFLSNELVKIIFKWLK
ncbi:MAG: response regulator, partial [Sediminibacterium sp.]